jgi:hypothetical protein
MPAQQDQGDPPEDPQATSAPAAAGTHGQDAQGQDRKPQQGGARNPAERANAAPGDKTPSKPLKPLKAIAFAARFAEVFEHELKVQKYEQQSLGLISLENLAGKRLEYRLRVDRDAEEFLSRLEAVPTDPLNLPRLSSARIKLSPRASSLVARINRAYMNDRDLRQLDFIFKTNEKFLATESWGNRQTVVQTRDNLLAREIAYVDLVATGHMILNQGLSRAELDDLEAHLDKISPGTKTAKSSIVQRLLTDAEFQAQVLDDLGAVLTARYDPQIPLETDEELLSSLQALQNRLLQNAGLGETKQQLELIDAELEKLDIKLEDMGVDVLSIDERRKIVRRKGELSRERNVKQFQWSHTTPPQPVASQLGTVQDTLIRRRLHDLGARGALFAYRYDMLKLTDQLTTESAPLQWAFLDAQADLITSLDEARPAPNPLHGMTFAPQQPANAGIPPGLLGNLPQPKPGKKAPKKGGDR